MGILGKKVPPPTKRKIPSGLPHFKVPSYMPTEGLAGCWLPFAGEGDALKDYSENGNDGTINGPTWTYKPSCAWTLSYDGTDDYVSIPTASNASSSGFTWLVWVKPQSLPFSDHNRVVHLGDGTGNNQIIISGDANYSRFIGQFCTGGTWQNEVFSDSVSEGTYHRLVLKWDGSTMELFLDAVSQGTQSPSYPSGLSETWLGAMIGGTYYINAVIGSYIAYTRVLPDDEIKETYEKTKPLYVG